jgi:hypothetical protein
MLLGPRQPTLLVLERGNLNGIASRYGVDISSFLASHKGNPIRINMSVEQFMRWNSSDWLSRLNMLSGGSFSMGERLHMRRDGSEELEDHQVRFRMGKNVCTGKGVISKSALEKLKKLISKTDEEGNHAERGALLSYKKEGDKYVFTLDESTLLDGENAETDVPDGKKGTDRCVESCAGAHTHPSGEYTAQNVAYAWPSHDDCQAFLDKVIAKKSFLHFVFTKEGVYIMSLHPNAIKKGSEFIRKSKKRTKAYKFALPTTTEEMSPEEYISKLEEIPESKKVFHVEFRTYENRKPFTFFYPTEGESCDI